MQSYIDLDDLALFLELEVIAKIEKRKIQFSKSKNSLIKYLIAGTMKYAYVYDKLAASIFINGPNICHDDYEEDNLYWNHIFSNDFWLEIGETVEKCLNWPPEFSQKWAIYLNEWLYNMIDIENSQVFSEYYSRDPDDDSDSYDKLKDKTDPYLIDYKGDNTYV